MNTHPGHLALQRVIAKANPPSDGVLALMYIEERLAILEKTMADRSRAFTPPTPQEAKEYADSIHFTLDGEAFCAFYEARGWAMGRSKMKSWKAAIRTWKQRHASEPQKAIGRLPDNLRTDHGL